MASIGLKVNHDQFGSALAGTLSKALLTDPSDAIAIEKMKSSLLTDEMQRRLLHEQTTKATYDAIAQAKDNQYKQAIFNAQTDMAGPMGKVLLAQQFQPEEVPAIVQESGGRGMPEALVPLAPQVSGGRGIPEHLVPLADDMPVPVEPQISGGRGVPEALVPMYPSETQVSGGRGMPESLVPTYPSAVQESGGRGMPEFRVPLAPEPVQPLVGAAPGPHVVSTGADPLIDLFGTEPPEVIADMLAGMAHPAVAGAPPA